MQDLGISVLFKGRNPARLLGGLGITLKLSLLSIVLSFVLTLVIGFEDIPEEE